MAEAAENMNNTQIQVTQHSERGAQEQCWVCEVIDDSPLGSLSLCFFYGTLPYIRGCLCSIILICWLLQSS